MKKESSKDPFVAFKYNTGTVDVVWGIKTLAKKEEGRFSCYLPGYNIFFSASSPAEMDKKAVALTQIYFKHFLNYKKNGIKALTLELHRLGFKAPQDALTISRILKNEAVNARFKAASTSPREFEGAEVSLQQSGMAMSI